MTRLQYVTRREWGWMHFKFSIGILFPSCILGARFLARTTTTGSIPSGLLYTWMGLCIVGALLCIFGIIARAQPESRYVIRGLAAELSGLVFMFSGPFLLFIAYLSQAITEGEPRYLTPMGLCYALSAVMVARWMEVLPTRRGARK